jgi:hypothetical protein
MIDPKTLVPVDKHDLRRANAAVAAGYPAVEAILDQLLLWLADINWPVAQVLAPFLATIGLPLAPHVRRALDGDDQVWKYWVVLEVIRRSRPLAEAFRADLERLARRPNPAEAKEEVDDAAREALAAYGWG